MQQRWRRAHPAQTGAAALHPTALSPKLVAPKCFDGIKVWAAAGPLLQQLHSLTLRYLAGQFVPERGTSSAKGSTGSPWDKVRQWMGLFSSAAQIGRISHPLL